MSTTKQIQTTGPRRNDANELTRHAEWFVKRAVPAGTDASHVVLSVNMELRRTPKLRECEPASLFAAIYQIAALGLLPGGPLGLAYLLPYGKRCQLIIGYRGMIQLAVGSGGARSIRAAVVADGDDFEWIEGLEPTIRHVPRSSAPPADRVTHAYAIADLHGGGQQWAVLTRDDIEARRKMAGGGRDDRDDRRKMTPWDSHYHEMAKKSAVRALCKMLALSPDRALRMHHAEAAEGGAVDEPTSKALADAGYVLDAEVVEHDAETGEVAP